MALVATYRGRWTTSLGTGVLTSSAISVLTGDAIVVAVIADSYQDLTTASVSMSTGWGFNFQTSHAFWGNSFDGGYAGIFAGIPVPSNGSPTITVTTAGSAQGHKRVSFEVWTVTGYDGSSPIAATGARDAFGNPMNVVCHSAPGTVGNSIAIIVGADGFSVGDPFVSGDGVIPGNGYTQPSGGGEPGISGFSTAATWANPDTDQALTIDPPGGSMAVYAIAWMEFQGSRAAPTVNAGADASHTFGTTPFTRTATETGSATSRAWTIQSGPAGAGSTIGTAAALSWLPTVAGVYVLRYSATNPFGTGTDDVTVTVNAVVPTVDAYIDRTVERTKGIIRTATEVSTGGATITGRQWRLMSGPGGSGAPVDLAAYGGDPMKCLLPNSVVGSHVIRYTATNSVGSGFDEATITVTALRPTVDAGPDVAVGAGLFTRTATETAGDNAITSRAWVIDSGPGAGTTIGTAAALSWTPPFLGVYVLKYTATSSAGTSDPDYATITVGVTGVALNIGAGTVKLAIAIAFAGDLTDPDGSSWLYTEVTTDVRVANGVFLRHGRSDEASVSQPAMCRFTLDNRHGKYSLGGRSPYWPNVRQGTPVAIYVDTGSGMETLFVGYADGFTPEYSISPLDATTGAGDATVELIASGALRRLAQGNPPVFSSMRRSMLQDTNVRAYWPCEDGKNATFISSGIPGYPPMDFSGRLHDGSNPNLPAAIPNLASSNMFDCSLELPQLNDSEWYGNVPAYTATNTISLWCLIDFPDSGSNDSSVLLGLITTGSPSFWEIRYMTTGDLNVRAWTNFTTLTWDTNYNFNLDGKHGLLVLELTTSGGNVAWSVVFIEEGATFGTTVNNTLAGTVGRALRVQTNTDGGHVQITMGHIAVRSAAFNLSDAIARLNAHNSDQVGERLFRITAENLLPYSQIDGDVPVDTVTDQMGPQRPNTVIGILRECETCDQGLLWDGISPGLTYSTKRYRESRPPALTLDVPNGQVAFPFVPVHDDANRRNRVTCQRQEGASAIYEDTTGPLGSSIIGRYDDSLDVNVEQDGSTFYYAGWLVHTGTIEGYRWPRLGINLAANPDLIDDWVGIIPGDRVDVTNLDDVNSSAPVEMISLAIEGFEQTITDSTWDVTLNTSPYYAWAVAQAQSTTGDTREFGMRADTSGSTVTTLIAAGQSTLSVTTTTGPLWTTAADDFPLYLDVGDIQVRATACSGSTSPQTFTIDPMPVAKPAGTAVKLWRPPVLGL